MRVERQEKVWKPIIITLDDQREAIDLYGELNAFNFEDYPGIAKLMTMLDEQF